MREKIKLLFYTELWANAGIESVIMSLFRNFDLSRISVDIMASQNISNFYDDEITRLGGRKIITLQEKYNSPAKRMAVNRSAFEKAIKKNGYDIVHIHMCNAAAMMYGRIAKDLGVKVVVYHSHNTNLSKSMRHLKTAVHRICKLRYEKYGDILFSCSDLASQWMFSKAAIRTGKVQIVKNAIDLDRFDYSLAGREDIRQKLNVTDKFVIGHIGRFSVAKNHPFLIDIFSELHKKNHNAVLLLIGEGEDEPAIRQKVKDFGLQDNVIFYGTTKDIPQMLWAMDAFVLPSFFEGNPVVGIEAQAAAIPCFFADTITKMCRLTDIVKYLSLSDSSGDWATAISEAKGAERHSTKVSMQMEGYDIKEVAAEVQRTYEKKLSKNGKH
jgi:glycosyltransferase involved in cell wall biosynthesis